MKKRTDKIDPLNLIKYNKINVFCVIMKINE